MLIGPVRASKIVSPAKILGHWMEEKVDGWMEGWMDGEPVIGLLTAIKKWASGGVRMCCQKSYRVHYNLKIQILVGL